MCGGCSCSGHYPKRKTAPRRSRKQRTRVLVLRSREQLLARSKRLRDTEAATINMQLVMWRDGQAANEAFVAGTGDALRTWRQK